MKLRACMFLFVVVLISCFLVQPTSIRLSGTNTVVAKQSMTIEQAQKSLNQSKSCFIENKGQWDSRILYMGDTSFGRIAFTDKAIYYELQSNDNKATSSHVIELSFEEPKQATIQGLKPLSHDTNYFIGNDSSKWATHCKSYRSVTYTNLWKGIDLAYFFTPQGLKYEYYVRPEAKIEDLKVRINGTNPSSSDYSRYLELTTPAGSLQDKNLHVFTQTTKQTLNASFQIQNNILSFSLPDAPRTETIVIDPLLYSTFLGGSGFETC